jgi:CRISPR/Cas system endoribonuclease Cas6 (RAMP superfamily)
MLPLNYRHAVAAMIYATLGQASTTFAARLHDTGFNADGRNFKLFTFSRLATRRARVADEKPQSFRAARENRQLPDNFLVDTIRYLR